MPIPAPTASELINTVLMGIGTVFFGLICLIVLTTIMGSVVRSMGKSAAPAAAPAPAAAAAPAARADAIPNRQAMIAAIAAVIAEEEGTDITGIRILSVKKL